MDFTDKFTEMGIGAIEGADIMKLANISVDDLHNNQQFSKIREIMQFYGNRPDGRYRISQLLAGKPGINSIDHLCSYARLRTGYESAMKTADELKEQLYYYER